MDLKEEKMDKSISDLAYEKTAPISEDVDRFNLKDKKDDPRVMDDLEGIIKSNKSNISDIVETYNKCIKLMRRHLEEAWIPLLKGGDINKDVFVDNPKDFTEKEWADKVKEINRILDSISLYMRG